MSQLLVFVFFSILLYCSCFSTDRNKRQMVMRRQLMDPAVMNIGLPPVQPQQYVQDPAVMNIGVPPVQPQQYVQPMYPVFPAQQSINDRFQSNPCQHDGMPYFDQSKQTTRCQCSTNYRGPYCQLPSTVCNADYCMNEGVCENRLGRPFCICLSGFNGVRCEEKSIAWNRCPINYCLHGGQCYIGVNQFTCLCNQDWYGSLCEKSKRSLKANSSSTTTTTTTSSASTTSTTKTTTINPPSTVFVKVPSPCSGNPCGNRGICILIYQQNMDFVNKSSFPSFKCECDVCCRGPRCEQCGNPCIGYVCDNGGECALDDQCKPYCDCSTTKLMGPRCNLNETCDPCSAMPCLHGGLCQPNDNSFICQCIGGWHGQLCQFEPNPCHMISCPNQRPCIVNRISQPQCYKGEVDPCFQRGRPCKNDGVCSMAKDPITRRPSRTGRCICAPHWQGGQCDIPRNPCNPNPCLHGGTCRPNGTHIIVCHCAAHLSGHFCQHCTPCHPNPCQNGGRCIQGSNFDFKCECRQPWQGSFCSNRHHPCHQVPCLHGGHCVINNTAHAHCKCIEGFVGQFCQYRDQCDMAPCNVIGTKQCITSTNGTYTCICRSGYQGVTCHYETTVILLPNFCHLYNPCQNGGTCVLDVNVGHFSCQCPSYFWGNECQLSSCSYGINHCFLGKCYVSPTDGRPLCKCNVTTPWDPNQWKIDILFTGERCELFRGRDYCNKVWCSGKGECEWIGSSIQPKDVPCICYTNYYGDHCQSTITTQPPTAQFPNNVSSPKKFSPCSLVECPPRANCYDLSDGGALCDPVRIEREEENITFEPYPQIHKCDRFICSPGSICAINMYNKARCYVVGPITKIVTFTEIVYITPPPPLTQDISNTTETSTMETTETTNIMETSEVTEGDKKTFWSMYYPIIIVVIIIVIILLLVLAAVITWFFIIPWYKKRKASSPDESNEETEIKSPGHKARSPDSLKVEPSDEQVKIMNSRSPSPARSPSTPTIARSPISTFMSTVFTPIPSPVASLESVPSVHNQTAIKATQTPSVTQPTQTDSASSVGKEKVQKSLPLDPTQQSNGIAPPVPAVPVRAKQLSQVALLFSVDPKESIIDQKSPSVHLTRKSKSVSSHSSPVVSSIGIPERKLGGVSGEANEFMEIKSMNSHMPQFEQFDPPNQLSQILLELKSSSKSESEFSFSTSSEEYDEVCLQLRPELQELLSSQSPQMTESNEWKRLSATTSILVEVPPLNFDDVKLSEWKHDNDCFSNVQLTNEYSDLQFIPRESRSANDELNLNNFYKRRNRERKQLLQNELVDIHRRDATQNIKEKFDYDIDFPSSWSEI